MRTQTINLTQLSHHNNKIASATHQTKFFHNYTRAINNLTLFKQGTLTKNPKNSNFYNADRRPPRRTIIHSRDAILKFNPLTAERSAIRDARCGSPSRARRLLGRRKQLCRQIEIPEAVCNILHFSN